jgi:aspartyl-tRNA(Asn)/glutamyl-tRNA(Gln) amidotransferase subunit B
MAENPRAVEDLRHGKERAAGAIVGSVMKKSRGKANPELVQRLIRSRL